MSNDSEERIARLMLTVTSQRPDVWQIQDWVREVVEAECADERKRCLLLTQQTQRRIMSGKGKNWLNELDTLIREIEQGQSLMEGAEQFTILTPNQKVL